MWNAASACKPLRISLFLLGLAMVTLGLSARAEAASGGPTKSMPRAGQLLMPKTASTNSRGKRSRSDQQPPSAPSGLAVSGANASGFTLAWSASYDNLNVAGYDVFRNGSKIGTTAVTTYSFTGLSCGQTYTVGVDAYDAAGNRSPQGSVQASTSSCPDTQAPTMPSFLVETSATVSSISLSWQPSLDNVGVAGYTVYANGTKSGTTGLTLYSLSNLTCGHSYTLAVDAYDAAGNHSPQTSVVASTAPCPTPNPPAPSPPACNFTLSPGQALPAASAGQKICLHGGTYSGGISYGSSGAAGSPITIMSYPGETALISGPSSGTALKVNGSYVKLDSLKVDNALEGIDITGDGVEIANSTVLHAGFGVFTEASADNTYVHDSTFTDNNRMIVSTACSVNCNDDYGAQAFEISGSNGHFSHNTVTGSWAVSSDYGHDGDAFEIWGGSGNVIDYNFGQNNAAFSELGKPSTRTCDNNHFYYNVVIGSLAFGINGIGAHGNEGFGPCYGTQVYNNSILISSPTSEPLRCGSCTATMMTLRNNAVRATGSGDVYNLSGSNEDYDILSGVGAPSAHGAHTTTADPLFVSATNLRTQVGSPAWGAGTPLGFTSDFVGAPVPSAAPPDRGAYQH